MLGQQSVNSQKAISLIVVVKNFEIRKFHPVVRFF